MEEDGDRDRSALLALLELEHRAKKCNLSTGKNAYFHKVLVGLCSALESSRLVSLMKQYFDKIGGKSCCFEDLKPYLSLEADDLISWTSFLESVSPSFVGLISCFVCKKYSHSVVEDYK